MLYLDKCNGERATEKDLRVVLGSKFILKKREKQITMTGGICFDKSS